MAEGEVCGSQVGHEVQINASLNNGIRLVFSWRVLLQVAIQCGSYRSLLACQTLPCCNSLEAIYETFLAR